ncbi:glycosyltransferase family 4 protein [Desulfovulcanus sp.]
MEYPDVSGMVGAVGIVLAKEAKVLFLVTEDWYFWSHRLPIARAARDMGMDVVVATRLQRHADLIREEGFRPIPLSWKRKSIHPGRELFSFYEILKIYGQEKPDIVHHVALKPVIYGTIAAIFARIPAVINALAGMGFIFASQSKKARLVRPFLLFLFRLLLQRKNTWLILQNPDDRDLFLSRNICSRDRIILIPGSGVDTAKFQPVPEPQDGVPVIVIVARMLWDKGVGELVEAAKILKDKGHKFEVWLVGSPDRENPASIPEKQLLDWHNRGLVKYLGYREDVSHIWRQAHIGVLPSYREGLPKSLLEGAASGRPLVTTDTPGCREVVRDGENGFLVPVRDARALADALAKLIEDRALRHKMGEKGRKIVEKEFSEQIVVEQTMNLYQRMLENKYLNTRK